MDERSLLDRYRRDGDLAARDAVVLRFLPLARQLASRYRGTGESHEDLVQIACVGLLKAVDRFGNLQLNFNSDQLEGIVAKRVDAPYEPPVLVA